MSVTIYRPTGPLREVLPQIAKAIGQIESALNTISGGSIALADPGSNGFVVRDSSGHTISRSVAGTAGQISVTNGSGVSANPSIGFVNDAVFPGTGGIAPPAGTTAQRPGSPGHIIRYNTDTTRFEVYEGAAWVNMTATPSQWTTWPTNPANIYFAGPITVGGAPPSGGAVAFEAMMNSNATYVTNAFGSARIRLINTDATNNNAVEIGLSANNSVGVISTGARLTAIFTNHASGAESADFVIGLRNAGTVGEVARFFSNGALKLTTYGAGYAKFDVSGIVSSVSTATVKSDLALTKSDVGLSNVDNLQQVPLSYLDTDVTLAANSDAKVATQKAVKAYADGLVVGLLDDRGNYDASSNLFPSSGGSGASGAILKGDLWYVSVAGVLGGQSVSVGSSVRALVNTPAQTAGNWDVLNAGLGYVPENVANKATGFATLNHTLYPTTQAVATALAAYQPTGNYITALTGDVTAAGPGSVAATIGAGKVTNTMLAGSIASSKLVGTDITVVGTIATGTWQGTIVASQYGGTGINNGGRTLTVSTNSGTLAFAGAATTMTFPSTSASIARTDAAQTFSGIQTFGANVDMGANKVKFTASYLGSGGTSTVGVFDSAGGAYGNLRIGKLWVSDSGDNIKFSIGQSGAYNVEMTSAGSVDWSTSGTQANTAKDTGMRRSAAGVVEFTNGTASQWGAVKCGVRDAGTNTVVDAVTVGHQSTGSVANGLGVGIAFNVNTTSTADQAAARLDAVWLNATHASRTSALILSTVNNAGAMTERMRVTGNGDVTITGQIIAGSTPTTITDAAGSVIATTLTGTINDARLSSNIPRLNAHNPWTSFQYINHTAAGAGTSGAGWYEEGVRCVRYMDSGYARTVSGAYFSAFVEHTASVTTPITGGTAIAYLNKVVGVEAHAWVDDASVVPWVIGVVAQASNHNSTFPGGLTTINNLAGIFVDADVPRQVDTAYGMIITASNGVAATTAYGIKIDGVAAVGAGAWGIYVNGTWENYFGGHTTIAGIIKAGSTPVSITNTAGKIVADAVLEPAFAGLTDGVTITWTFAGAQSLNHTVTLAGNRTLAISGATNGATGVLIVKQDATGSRTLTLPAGSKVVNAGGGAVTLSTAANAVDILSFVYDGTNYWWTIGKNYN